MFSFGACCFQRALKIYYTIYLLKIAAIERVTYGVFFANITDLLHHLGTCLSCVCRHCLHTNMIAKNTPHNLRRGGSKCRCHRRKEEKKQSRRQTRKPKCSWLLAVAAMVVFFIASKLNGHRRSHGGVKIQRKCE